MTVTQVRGRWHIVLVNHRDGDTHTHTDREREGQKRNFRGSAEGDKWTNGSECEPQQRADLTVVIFYLYYGNGVLVHGILSATVPAQEDGDSLVGFDKPASAKSSFDFEYDPPKACTFVKGI